MDIKVRGDPWLGRDDNFFVQTSIIDGLEEFSVSGLSDSSTWNVRLIDELLLPIDAEVVIRTSLPVLPCVDKRI